MGQVQIGQDSAAVSAGEQALESDGTTVITTYLGTVAPWTKLPIVSFFVNTIVSKIVVLFIGDIDKLAFAGYIAVQTGKQVSDYIAAEAGGNQTTIDQSGDTLIGLGKT